MSTRRAGLRGFGHGPIDTQTHQLGFLLWHQVERVVRNTHNKLLSHGVIGTVTSSNDPKTRWANGPGGLLMRLVGGWPARAV